MVVADGVCDVSRNAAAEAGCAASSMAAKAAAAAAMILSFCIVSPFPEVVPVRPMSSALQGKEFVGPGVGQTKDTGL